MHRILGIVCLFAVGACAGAPGIAPVTPADIPELERAGDDADAVTLTRLGIAYGLADRPADALRALEAAVRLPAPPPIAWAHLGTWRDEAGDLDGAADAYRRFLARRDAPGRGAVESRLAAVEREILRRHARDALAIEAELAGEAPDRRRVGVLPMLVEGPPEYEALGVGLADLLTTDLSITDRLEVVERAQFAALLTEMQLALGGFTDAEAAARAGRLLRAGRLVQGQIAIAAEGGDTRVIALVVDASAAGTEAEATAAGPLEALFAMETQLALDIYRALGIELTPAERARIEDKPTRNLQAFLAYSEGLRLMDEGDFGGAASRFRGAATLDPGFTAAEAAAQQAARIGQATLPGDLQTTLAGLSFVAPALPGTDGVSGLERLVDSTVPAGPATTDSGSGGQNTGADGATAVQPTEVTAGTGTSQSIRVPIILVRPSP